VTRLSTSLLAGLEEAALAAAGSKKLEVTVHCTEDNLTINLSSRRLRIEPKAFLLRLRDMAIEGELI
jgi:DNA polymerase III subunit alpha